MIISKLHAKQGCWSLGEVEPHCPLKRPRLNLWWSLLMDETVFEAGFGRKSMIPFQATYYTVPPRKITRPKLIF